MFYKLLCALLFIPALLLNSLRLLAQEGEFIDHGFIPASLNVQGTTCEFQSMIYHDNAVFIGTSDGIWKNDLLTKEWSRAGLDGKKISAIYSHPTIPGKFFAGVFTDNTSAFKTLYISNDSAGSWAAAEQPLYDSLLKSYENYVCFAVRPGFQDHIYANVSGGAMIAVSTDGGNRWVRKNYAPMSYLGYQSCIGFLAGFPNQLFQGSENPLDIAWLGSYDINEDDPVIFDTFRTIIGLSTWGNRRPNQLQTYNYTGKNIYIGQEGALTKVTDTTVKFIYKSGEGSSLLYSYMYGLWVDPNDTNHLLFGGALNHEEQPMQLYETYDEGVTVHRFTEKYGMDNPQVREIISTNPYPGILLNDQDAEKVKLLIYRPDALSIDKQMGNISQCPLEIYPNPVKTTLYLDDVNQKNKNLDDCQITIVNLFGQVLFKTTIDSARSINMRDYPQGVYIVYIKCNGGTWSRKVLKI